MVFLEKKLVRSTLLFNRLRPDAANSRQLIYFYVNTILYNRQAVERVINRVSQFYSVVGIVQINLLWLLSGVIEVNTATKFHYILPLPPK